MMTIEYVDFVPEYRFVNGGYTGNWNGMIWVEEPSHFYYPKELLVPARRPNLWKNSGYDYGWALTRQGRSKYWARLKGDNLKNKGWQGFRKGSVPSVHNYKNHVSPNRSNGMLKENKENDKARDYGVKIRSKRGKLVEQGIDYDFHYSYNAQRSWKRTKKRKQWM